MQKFGIIVDMKPNCQNKKIKFKRELIFCAVSFALFLVMLLLKTNVKICEWWTVNVSQKIVWLASTLTGWFGFSLFEFLCAAVIVIGIVLLVTIIVLFCRQKGRVALKILAVVLCVALTIVCVYTASAGFAYNRKELPVQIKQGDIERTKINEYAEYFVDLLNDVSRKIERDKDGVVVCPYTTKKLSDLLSKEYERLDKTYFYNKTPRAKGVTLSKIMSQAQITGVFFAPTGEVNINVDFPKSTFAVTMAHEMAHGKGVMRENDANLLAYYVTLMSDDYYVKYNALFSLVGSVARAVSYYPDSLAEWKALIKKISPEVTNEMNFYNEYWKNHDKLAKIEEWFNDLYLKMSGVKQGTKSYVDGDGNEYGEDLDGDGRKIATKINFSRPQRMVFLLIEKGCI